MHKYFSLAVLLLSQLSFATSPIVNPGDGLNYEAAPGLKANEGLSKYQRIGYLEKQVETLAQKVAKLEAQLGMVESQLSQLKDRK